MRELTPAKPTAIGRVNRRTTVDAYGMWFRVRCSRSERQLRTRGRVLVQRWVQRQTAAFNDRHPDARVQVGNVYLHHVVTDAEGCRVLYGWGQVDGVPWTLQASDIQPGVVYEWSGTTESPWGDVLIPLADRR